ncbi:MAG: urea transporter [Muribaculaceae bacterium]|nr:urea transporter [Muribaculaceae bacterium]
MALKEDKLTRDTQEMAREIELDVRTVPWREFPRTTLRGVGQVMFQDNMWTGLLFLCGIFWGAYEEGFPLVAWGALAGVLSSTLAGYILNLPDQKGAQGLWGFNGALVGCAFPTFLGESWAMWIALVLCAAMSTWVRSGLDNVMGKWGVSSLTFPFVISTYIFLLAARYFYGMPPTHLSSPELLTLASPDVVAQNQEINMQFGELVKYWLRGVSQVFLINSWVTGIFFLVALAVSSIRACIWAAVASALSLFIALCWGGPGLQISEGLYGFSAVLTGIALGATFCNFSWRAGIWCVLGIVATVFVQAAMNAFFSPMGLPTLTGPFCITTWFFLFPAYKMFAPKPAAQ